MNDILFLAHRVPFPPNRGDKIRSFNLLMKLASLGRVHVGCLSENEEDRAAAAHIEDVSATHCVVDRTKPLVLAGAQAVLSGKPVSVAAFHSPKLAQWVRNTIENEPIATIVVFSGQMGQYIPEDFTGRVITDLCDVDSAKFEGYAKSGERVWLNAREARLLAAEEERLARRSDATLLISEAEASVLRSRMKAPRRSRLIAMGNGIDAEMFDPAGVAPPPELHSATGPHFVFTGQMNYRPNEAAALWVLEHFLPLARERFPKTRFHVVGREPTPAVKRHSDTPGARIWGEVPDVRPFLAGATCALAPLLIARGVQNKVLEAMAMARPVLLTPQAATGIAASDGEHWIVEKPDPDGMMARLEALMVEPGFAERMGRAARDFVLANHDWDATLAPLARLIGSDLTEEKRDAA